jgi:cytoskeleton protein RodZ
MGVEEQWKKKREAMGMSLEDVSGELHIGQRYLRNIEEGNFEGWPERVFSGGFIRAYAKLLSEDPEPVLSEYYRYLEQKAAAQAPAPPVRPMWLERERERGTRRTSYAAAAAFVLLIGVVLAWISWRTGPRPLPPMAGAPAVPGAFPGSEADRPEGFDPAAVDGGAETADGTAPNGRAALTEAPPTPGPGARGDAAPTVGTAAAPVGGWTAPEGLDGEASASRAGEAKGPYRLTVAATELTWMLYSVDGAEPVDVTLYPGDRVSISAKERLTVRLGNAGGVTGILNGKKLPPFGSMGQVKVIRLGE